MNLATSISGNPETPALVILHGLFGSKANWASHQDYFSQSFYVISMDLPGHGESETFSEYSYSSMASAVCSTLKELSINSAYVLGHSMGAKVAIQLANTHPNIVNKLILLDMTPLESESRHNEVFDALKSVNLNQLSSRSDAKKTLIPALGPIMSGFFLKSLIQSSNNQSWDWAFDLNGLFRDYANILSEVILTNPITVPTLLCRGGASDYVPDTYLTKFQDQFSNGLFTTIPDAGHWIHMEKPTQVRTIVQSFINVPGFD